MNMEYPEPPAPRRGSDTKWIGIWSALAIVGALSIALPLVLTPAATPRAQTKPTATATAPAPTATSEVSYPLPIRITSPAANINGDIIPVGVDSTGAMAAPEGPNSDPVWFQGFWWEYGVKPGQVGNAVIAGHLDRKDGSPALFWGLRKLKVGDSVYVRTVAETTLHFRVTRVQTFYNPTGGADDPIIQQIFGPATTPNLNLITCTGDWTGKEYTKKLVVFTTLVP
jgi:sortase A